MHTLLKETYIRELIESISALEGCDPTLGDGVGIEKSNFDNNDGNLVPNFDAGVDAPNDSLTTSSSVDGATTEEITTTQEISTTTQESSTTSFDDSEDDLPLCSEVSTAAPKIGFGLISKFGIGTTTSKPIPCRNEDFSSVGSSSSSSSETTTTTTTTAKSGILLQQLAEKFGGR